jgi:hypothetical protein
MQRIITIFFMLGASFILRTMFSSGGGGSNLGDVDDVGPSEHHAASVGFRGSMILYLAKALGLASLSPEELSLLTTIATIYSFVLGWSMDLVLREHGFGRYLNGLIAFLGGFVGLLFYAAVAGTFEKSHLSAVALLAIFSSAGGLLLASAAKAWVLAEADDHLSGGRPSKPTTARGNAATANERFNKIANRSR